jgi:DNA-binding NarL/FixJ family response regulator
MSIRPATILLVEDNPGDATLIREELRDEAGEAFRLIHADRLSAAIDRLREGPVDAVLLDLGLPDSRGLETFLGIRTQTKEIPIVVLSGLDDEALALEAVHQGAQDYLVKGNARGALLVRSLRYAIERQQLISQLLESATSRKAAEDALRKSQTTHLWQSIFAILGSGGSPILFKAGAEAGTHTFDFIRSEWEPRNEAELLRGLQEYLRSAEVCEVEDWSVNRAGPSVSVRSRRNFETLALQGGSWEPVCHFLRGMISGISERLLGIEDLVCDELTCEAKGDEVCQFAVRRMFR